MYLEFAMSILGMDREQAAWHLPAATGVRMQAAYLERSGVQLRWQESGIDKVLRALNSGK